MKEDKRLYLTIPFTRHADRVLYIPLPDVLYYSYFCIKDRIGDQILTWPYLSPQGNITIHYGICGRQTLSRESLHLSFSASYWITRQAHSMDMFSPKMCCGNCCQNWYMIIYCLIRRTLSDYVVRVITVSLCTGEFSLEICGNVLIPSLIFHE